MVTKVTISIYWATASTDGNTWVCDDPDLLKLLNIFAGADNVKEYTPSRAYSMAMLAEKELLTNIISEEYDDDGFKPGVIY